jgi:hypothetical protein
MLRGFSGVLVGEGGKCSVREFLSDFIDEFNDASRRFPSELITRLIPVISSRYFCNSLADFISRLSASCGMTISKLDELFLISVRSVVLQANCVERASIEISI